MSNNDETKRAFEAMTPEQQQALLEGAYNKDPENWTPLENMAVEAEDAKWKDPEAKETADTLETQARKLGENQDIDSILQHLFDNFIDPGLIQTSLKSFHTGRTPKQLEAGYEYYQAQAADCYLAGNVKWCNELGWLVFNPKTGAFSAEYADKIVYEVLIYLNKKQFHIEAETKSMVSRQMYHLARGNSVYCLAREFDRDPYLLNCQGYTYNLKTGTYQLATPADMHTKSAISVSQTPLIEIRTPTFDRFLADITCGDNQLMRWIRRWMGYCLTGDVKAAYFANFYGSGGNGKGVLLRLMLNMLGSYAVSLSSKAVVLQGKEMEGRFEYSALPGARLAVVDDVPAGRLAEGSIKTLTGEGTMRTERKYHDSFEFRPIVKLVIASNQQLSLKDTGNSMKRRLRTVPFNFKPEMPDTGLEGALLMEAPEIFAMLIEEAKEYLQNPGPAAFPQCDAIEKASAEYIESQDTVRLFLNEKTELCAVNEIKTADLYTAYKGWCESNGYRPLSTTRFGLDLKRNGIEREHRMNGNWYLGIKFKDQ